MNPLHQVVSENDIRALGSQLGAEQPQLIAKGTEAHVYALDNARVLKVYLEPAALSKIKILHDFYERASTERVNFKIPRIHEFGQYRTAIYSVEDRLAGTPMADIPAWLTDPTFADLYIDTILQISRITIDPPYTRRKLFETEGTSQDWNGYICHEIHSKFNILSHSLPSTVVEKLGPLSSLERFFATPYSGKDSLIHGDYHPGNVLVLDESRVNAIVDFGTFSMFGDPLYDVATGCGFFSMYEPDQIAIRRAMLERLFLKDATIDRVRIHAYLLCAALLTCDLYPDSELPIYETGHFGWAMSVLEDDRMWESIA